MSTNTNTTTTTKVVVKSAAEVVKSYGTFLTADAAMQNSFINVGISGLKVAARQGYADRQTVSEMFRLSIYEQEGVAELADDDAKKVAVADRIKTNVSMWTAFVVCKDEATQKERDKALAYNDGLPKGHKPNLRIGQKLMLDICRGQSSADDVIAVKEGREPSKPTRASGQEAKGATTDKATPDAKGTPAEGDANAPEGQAASLPTPDATAKPIGNPKDAMRANLKTAITAYESNLGVSKADIAAILRETADALDPK